MCPARWSGNRKRATGRNEARGEKCRGRRIANPSQTASLPHTPEEGWEFGAGDGWCASSNAVVSGAFAALDEGLKGCL